jgi:glycosyltransferase involved in cell wall biosynthesis
VRILHINRLGTLSGGVEGYLDEVIRALAKAGHESYLAYYERSKGSPIPAAHFAPLPEWPAPAEAGLRALDRIIAEFRPDAAYLHVVLHPQLMTYLTSRLPTVAYVHGMNVACPGSMTYFRRSEEVCTQAAGFTCLINAQTQRCCWGRNPRNHWNALTRVKALLAAYRTVPVIAVGSRHMQDVLTRNAIPKSQIARLSPILIEPPLLAMIPSPPQSRSVLFAGRLVPEKGLQKLIRALALLETEWELLVAGEGEEQGPATALAADLGVAERVRFLGWQSNAALAELYRQAACVAVPSLWPEPFGRTGIEAFMHGRPVVGFATGGIPDWLDDGRVGYLVQPNDIAGFSQAISRLLESPELRDQMGQAARSKIMHDYDAKRHVHTLLEFFERAAQTSPVEQP